MWDAHPPHFAECTFKSLISYLSESTGNRKGLISHTIIFLDVTVQNFECFSGNWEIMRLQIFFLLVSKAFQKYLFLSKGHRRKMAYRTWSIKPRTWWKRSEMKIIVLVLKYFIFKQTQTWAYPMKKQEDVLKKGKKRFEGLNNREVNNLNLKLCGLALMRVNHSLSH